MCDKFCFRNRKVWKLRNWPPHHLSICTLSKSESYVLKMVTKKLLTCCQSLNHQNWNLKFEKILFMELFLGYFLNCHLKYVVALVGLNTCNTQEMGWIHHSYCSIMGASLALLEHLESVLLGIKNIHQVSIQELNPGRSHAFHHADWYPMVHYSHSCVCASHRTIRLFIEIVK